MLVYWKVFLTILILYTIAIHGNRIHRRRRQAALADPNIAAKSFNQQQLPPDPRILNGPGQSPPQPGGNPNEFGTGKNSARQYYYPYQGQYGYGSVQSLNYPYGGASVGAFNYGSGPYSQYGSGQYGAQQYGYGSYYNRPGYSNNYPSGGNYYGGYFWNAGQKQNINKFTVFLSSLLTLVICLIII